jgi:hypothetical protein
LAAARPVGQAADRAPAAAIQERMRSWINSRSNSTMPAHTVAIVRPCGVERSKAMPFSADHGGQAANALPRPARIRRRAAGRHNLFAVNRALAVFLGLA